MVIADQVAHRTNDRIAQRSLSESVTVSLSESLTVSQGQRLATTSTSTTTPTAFSQGNLPPRQTQALGGLSPVANHSRLTAPGVGS